MTKTVDKSFGEESSGQQNLMTKTVDKSFGEESSGSKIY